MRLPRIGLRVSLQLELGSTRALACTDRRPRRSEFGANRSPKGEGVGRLVWSARAPTTAREGACAPPLNRIVTAQASLALLVLSTVSPDFFPVD